MATYRYCAIHGETGNRTQDTTEVDNVALFLQEMHEQGYVVTSLKKLVPPEVCEVFTVAVRLTRLTRVWLSWNFRRF